MQCVAGQHWLYPTCLSQNPNVCGMPRLEQRCEINSFHIASNHQGTSVFYYQGIRHNWPAGAILDLTFWLWSDIREIQWSPPQISRISPCCVLCEPRFPCFTIDSAWTCSDPNSLYGCGAVSSQQPNCAFRYGSFSYNRRELRRTELNRMDYSLTKIEAVVTRALPQGAIFVVFLDSEVSDLQCIKTSCFSGILTSPR